MLKIIVLLIGLYSLGFFGLVYIHIFGNGDINEKAIITMSFYLILFWCIIGGITQYLFRDFFKKIFDFIPIKNTKKFLIFCIFLAAIEELIATNLTKSAEIFGGIPGEAFITASTNYFEVIFFHSLIIFIPMFYAWSKILSKYNIHPTKVFLVFGLTGTIAESFMSISAFFSGFWIFVYGLMVWLPAYCLYDEKSTKKSGGIKVLIISIFLPIIYALPAVFLALFLQNTISI